MIMASYDRKTCNYSRDKNTFGTSPGLPAEGGTCPSATTGAGGCWNIAKGRKLPDCYAIKLKVRLAGVCKSLEHNTKELMSCSGEERVNMFRLEFERFLATYKATGRTDTPYYRIHWSGDIPDRSYAEDLAAAMRSCPGIKFWLYTRTFDVVDVLLDIANLVLFISLDSCNRDKGLTVLAKYKSRGLRAAYMSKEKPELPDGLQVTVCPVDTNLIALQTACVGHCKKCLRRDSRVVWFQS